MLLALQWAPPIQQYNVGTYGMSYLCVDKETKAQMGQVPSAKPLWWSVAELGLDLWFVPGPLISPCHLHMRDF